MGENELEKVWIESSQRLDEIRQKQELCPISNLQRKECAGCRTDAWHQQSVGLKDAQAQQDIQIIEARLEEIKKSFPQKDSA